MSLKISMMISTFMVLSIFFRHAMAEITSEAIAQLTNSVVGVESVKNFYYGSEDNLKLFSNCFQFVKEFSCTNVKLISNVEVGKAESGAVLICYNKENNDEDDDGPTETYFALTKYLFYYIKVQLDNQQNAITSYLDVIELFEQKYNNEHCQELKQAIWDYLQSGLEGNKDKNEDNESEEEDNNYEEENAIGKHLYNASGEDYKNYKKENCLKKWEVNENDNEEEDNNHEAEDDEAEEVDNDNEEENSDHEEENSDHEEENSDHEEVDGAVEEDESEEEVEFISSEDEHS